MIKGTVMFILLLNKVKDFFLCKHNNIAQIYICKYTFLLFTSFKEL